ncbi:hypothetical protein PDJAM_G00030520 [Pangasius djambal]|uniref:Uncharacterized protein n=1 Tax=Pangasius djambal TaxID=1691987 RepID=A0ACC5YRB5_9TELE|nr:hypothetical protein [Pangasius djambal]
MVLPAQTQEGRIYLRLENMWRLYAQEFTGFSVPSKSHEKLNAKRMGNGKSGQCVRKSPVNIPMVNTCHILGPTTGRNLRCVETLWERVYPRRQTYKSLPPREASLRQQDRGARSGSHIQVIEPGKSQGSGPSRSVADALQGHTCREGLRGRHRSGRVSLDRQRTRENRGLESQRNGFYNPPAEGLLRSRKTPLRGTKAHKKLARLSRTGHVQLSFRWSGSRKGGGQKACSTTGRGAEEGTFGTYPARGYKNALANPGAKSK